MFEETSLLIKICIILIAIVFILGAGLGNLALILIYFSNKKIQNPSNAYFICLAVVDILIGFVLMPLTFLYLYTNNWTLGIGTCKFYLMGCYSLSCARSAHLVLIALDRYRIVVHGVSYLHRRTFVNNVELSCTIWFISVWIVLPVLIDWDHIASDPEVHGICALKKTPSFFVLVILTNFILPVGLLTRLYTQLFLLLRAKATNKFNKQNALQSTKTKPEELNNIGGGDEETITELTETDAEDKIIKQPLSSVRLPKSEKFKVNLKRERTAAWSLGIIIVGCYVCWIPFAVLFLLEVVGIDIAKSYFLAGAIVGWTSSSFNPIVLTIRNRDFNQGLMKMWTSTKNLIC
ncbi:tyramine/octopamine receptor-like [Folsomia candida]|uniref:tyramine/octopamine receptor-like n=1 Tax=Folsomia candida TaxID=158441 RepID=UPI001604A5D4|nr:tyramine/octopamine receptor-like [Folsomia candida]